MDELMGIEAALLLVETEVQKIESKIKEFDVTTKKLVESYKINHDRYMNLLPDLLEFFWNKRFASGEIRESKVALNEYEVILESIDEMAVEIDAILEKLGNIQIATELFWAALLIRKDFVIDRLAEIEANVGVSEKNWTPPKFLANTQCYVCQNELGENKNLLRQLLCGHVFHQNSCIDQWLLEHNTCPVCRAVCGSLKLPNPTITLLEKPRFSVNTFYGIMASIGD